VLKKTNNLNPTRVGVGAGRALKWLLERCYLFCIYRNMRRIRWLVNLRIEVKSNDAYMSS
jgi:hypothetical protein